MESDNSSLKLEFSEKELEILQNFENARHLRDTCSTPGWGIFLKIKEQRLEQIKRQFMMAKVDKESLWAMQVRLNGIVEFLDVLLEGVANAIECLDPDAMKGIIAGARIERADLDGEIGLKEI